ncbi:MAG: hypothetical protein KME50_34270 [Nostoc desertorum CM1-VF14]|jgi:hypothetical protein|nr:hypothetical protein [Nostoc desertorum CM1-VF14]
MKSRKRTASQFLRCIFKRRFDRIGEHKPWDSHSRDLEQARTVLRFLSSTMAGILFLRNYQTTKRFYVFSGEYVGVFKE